MWKKVVTPIILVSLLWVMGSSISTYFIHLVSASHAKILRENVATIRAAWAMRDALRRLQVIVVESAGKEVRESQVEAEELEALFERRLLEAEQVCFTEEERTLAKAIREHFAIYRDHIQPQLQPPGLTELLLPQTAEKEKTIRLARAVAEPCRQLLALNERMLTDSMTQSARLSHLVNALRFAFVVAGPLVGVVCGLWIARGMHRSISQISVTLKGATGDLDQQLDSVEVAHAAICPNCTDWHKSSRTESGTWWWSSTRRAGRPCRPNASPLWGNWQPASRTNSATRSRRSSCSCRPHRNNWSAGR